jgi:photosystem II stability/assembly factor-like uncharacterized protein
MRSADDPRLVLLATRVGFWMSGDAGATWRSLAAPKGAQVNSVAILRGEPRVIFAAANEGLYHSSDLGQSWTLGGWGLPRSDVTGLAVHPDGRTVYVSDFKWGGVYRSEDRGQTWIRFPDAGLASDRVWTLGLDPLAPNELLAASTAGGLHLFTLTPRPPSAPTAAQSGSDRRGPGPRSGGISPGPNLRSEWPRRRGTTSPCRPRHGHGRPMPPPESHGIPPRP